MFLKSISLKYTRINELGNWLSQIKWLGLRNLFIKEILVIIVSTSSSRWAEQLSRGRPRTGAVTSIVPAMLKIPLKVSLPLEDSTS